MSAVREDLCLLSSGEAERATDNRLALRSHYDLMVVTATKARDELRAQLHKGLPALTPDPQYANCYDGMLLMQHRNIVRLVNAYAWANRVLWMAAQAVCDCEELEDDGVAEGIVWELTL